MRLPDEIKKCVVFFGIPSTEMGVTVTRYKATGFFVFIPVGDETKRGFLYLVTAKHSAEKLAGKEFVIRANTKDGKSMIMKSSADAQFNWHFHPTDGNADVVVFPWPESAANMDINAVPVSSFLKSENLNPDGVGIGDEVCIIGLFKFHKGESRNHPMARIGSIAMIPDEKVSTQRDGEIDAYLIEARSTGGMSGSPVFVASLRVSESWLLLGLIYGHWDLPESQVNDSDLKNTERNDSDKQDMINSGIVIVTPAQKILDILYNEELSNARQTTMGPALDGPVRD